VFVEFTDETLRRFLSDLREALLGRGSTKPLHITVRGPYRGNPPRAKEFERLQEALLGLGVRLTGSGRFDTSKGHVVFMRAESSAFREIWWKPDFPQREFGFNPHLTIYETSKLKNAQLVEAFLKNQRINIHTSGVRLSLYTARQLELISVEPPQALGRLSTPTDYGAVDPLSLIDKAKALSAQLEVERTA